MLSLMDFDAVYTDHPEHFDRPRCNQPKDQVGGFWMCPRCDSA